MNNNLQISMFGESHTKYIGLKVSPMPIGLTFNEQEIFEYLQLRQGLQEINTARREIEKIKFLTGVKGNKVVANEVCFVLENSNYRPKDYEFGIIRPAHADIVGYQLEGENFSYQGGGKFSGRLTALYVVLGIMLKQYLSKNYSQLKVNGQIKQIGSLVDQDIMDTEIEQLEKIDHRFPVLDQTVKTAMLDYLSNLKSDGDSHGAKLKFRIDNLPVGVGGLYFSSFESILSKNLFAIGAIKGISFGDGFEYQNQLGSQSNDQLYLNGQNIYSPTNHQGGINGGFSNGIQPIYFEVAVRPTPTIFKEQNTVRLTKSGYVEHQYTIKGRHDSFIANRISVVIEAMVYISLYEMEL